MQSSRSTVILSNVVQIVVHIYNFANGKDYSFRFQLITTYAASKFGLNNKLYLFTRYDINHCLLLSILEKLKS